MGMEILILKKAIGYASLKISMGINGKIYVGIYRSIMFYRIEEDEGFNFLRKGRFTYVTGHEVNWIFFHVNTTSFWGFGFVLSGHQLFAC
jgi:hypothetical protein